MLQSALICVAKSSVVLIICSSWLPGNSFAFQEETGHPSAGVNGSRPSRQISTTLQRRGRRRRRRFGARPSPTRSTDASRKVRLGGSRMHREVGVLVRWKGHLVHGHRNGQTGQWGVFVPSRFWVRRQMVAYSGSSVLQLELMLTSHQKALRITQRGLLTTLKNCIKYWTRQINVIQNLKNYLGSSSQRFMSELLHPSSCYLHSNMINGLLQVLMQYDPGSLHENGGDIKLNPTWAKSFLKRMGIKTKDWVPLLQVWHRSSDSPRKL